MIRAAYLRVYLPPEDTGSWRPQLRTLPVGRIVTLGNFGLSNESLTEDAFEVEHYSRRWICPRYPRLRMLEGLLAFRDSYPGMTGSLLAPEQVVVRASAELEGIYNERPLARSYILTSSWHVPLRWFAAFDPDERELFDGPGGVSSIRYRTMLPAAMSRLDHAVAVLDDVGFDESVIGQVRDLTGWLGGFPEDALLELDYGSVAGLFSEGELAMDESASDVAASLAALEREDLDEAGRYYASAAGRWAHAQFLMYSN